MILVSACLCGVNSKYNGGNNENNKVLEFLKEKDFLLVCPEQLGGLTTPRTQCEIANGSGEQVLTGKAKVLNVNGLDCTNEFIKGAQETLKIALKFHSDTAILKSNSPSCGYGRIYDGSFLGKLADGNGVTSELLMQNGIKILTEKDIANIENRD